MKTNIIHAKHHYQDAVAKHNFYLGVIHGGGNKLDTYMKEEGVTTIHDLLQKSGSEMIEAGSNLTDLIRNLSE